MFDKSDDNVHVKKESMHFMLILLCLDLSKVFDRYNLEQSFLIKTSVTKDSNEQIAISTYVLSSKLSSILGILQFHT